MPLTGAEKQRRYIQRLKQRAAGVSNAAPLRPDPLDDIIGTCDCCARANTVVGLICKECQEREGWFEIRARELKAENVKLKAELAQAKARGRPRPGPRNPSAAVREETAS
jgi:hypothetical protein